MFRFNISLEYVIQTLLSLVCKDVWLTLIWGLPDLKVMNKSYDKVKTWKCYKNLSLLFYPVGILSFLAKEPGNFS